MAIGDSMNDVDMIRICRLRGGHGQCKCDGPNGGRLHNGDKLGRRGGGGHRKICPQLKTGGVPVVVGIGIDLVEIHRMKKAVEKPLFVQRVFTPAEQGYCDGRGRQNAASYAARFAAKEAVMKALGDRTVRRWNLAGY